MTANRSAIELVAIGDELLFGDTVDTNGSWLSQQLTAHGIRVVRRTVVGDDDAAIRSAVGEALDRTGVVVCSGGLGPTPDDRTRDAVAGLYGWPLEIDDDWVESMRQRFQARGLAMAESNRVQAQVPRGAVMFRNDVGTAPGLALEDDALGITVLLPGVPGELRWLMEHAAGPWLRQRLTGSGAPIPRRVLRTTGIAESALAEKIADIVVGIAPVGVAFLPTGTGIDLRLTIWSDAGADDASAALDRAEQRLRERLGAAVYGTGTEDLAAVVGAALRRGGLTLCVAESCTGGLLSKRLTDEPGASDFYIAGVTSYADDAKIRLLGVSEPVIREHGAVSGETAEAMLEGIMAVTGADCGLSITGIAGPAGGSPGKPVGTVWVGAAAADRRRLRRLHLSGTRTEIRERSGQAALKILLGLLEQGA